MIDILSNIATYVLGFLTAIFAEPIRQKIFSPRLKLSFKDTPQHKVLFITDRVTNRLVTYLRIGVVNEKRTIAKNCRAHLISIERWSDKKNKYKSSSLQDSLQLAWACKKPGEEFLSVDLAKDVHQFIDVVHAVKDEGRLEPHLYFIPLRYEDLFNFPGQFRYTIQVSADKTEPETIQIKFEWQGKGCETNIK
jgi:hypothetical protein